MGHPEGLLFVAVAVAWAIYLIPKAIEHHHAANSSRTVDRFSHTLRVLARREPVNRRKAQLVVTGRPQPGATAGDASTAGEPATEGAVATDPAPGPSPAEGERIGSFLNRPELKNVEFGASSCQILNC